MVHTEILPDSGYRKTRTSIHRDSVRYWQKQSRDAGVYSFNTPSQNEAFSRSDKKSGELLVRAERPVVVPGGGVYLSRAFEELRIFAETFATPILTSAGGKGSIPEDHPLSAGCIGMYRTQVGKRIWEEADLVIGIGTRFEEIESGAWEWFPKNAKLIQVDIDPTEIGRNWIPDVAIVGDAKLPELESF
jgi:acetolactate synthase-1/2/3 large subunit